MNAEHNGNSLPPMLDLDGQSAEFITHLLAEKLIRYSDARFQVSSGENHFIMQLVRDENECILFYAQIPSIYPMPDDLKNDIKLNLESVLKATIDLQFVNAGTEAQKKDIVHSASLSIGDE